MAGRGGFIGTTARTIRDLFRRAAADRLDGLAAEIAFFAVLSLFPGLMIFAAALGWLDRIVPYGLAQGAETEILGWLGRVLTDRAGGVLSAVKDVLEQPRGSVLGSAILVGVWVLSTAFCSVIRALDRIYGVKEGRSWLNVRATALALAAGSVVILSLVVTSFVIGPLLGQGRLIADRLGMGGTFTFIWDWLRTPLALVALLLWTTTLYRLAPNHRESWLRGLPGSIFSGVLLVILSRGFGFYLGLSAGFNQVFTVLGGGLILLVWLYAAAYVLLLGGELNAIRAGNPRRAGRASRRRR